MIIELVALLALMVGGSAAARLAGVRGWPLPAVGLLTGAGLAVAVGTVQAVIGWTSPIVTMLGTAAIPVGAWAVVSRREDMAIGIRSSLFVVGALVPAVAGLRAAGLVNLSPDSFAYVTVGSLLDKGSLDLASPQLLQTRVLAVPVLHAPANLQDEFYLRSLTPLLAVAALGLLAWLCREALRATRPSTTWVVVTVAAVMVVVTNNRFVFHAFYLNGHLLVGALLLLLVGAAWLATRDSGGELGPDGGYPRIWMISAIVIPALVVARPEGFLVAGLALLPILSARHLPGGAGPVLLAVYGLSVLAWHAVLAARFAAAPGSVPSSVMGPAALGAVIVLVAGALLLSRRWRRLPAWSPMVVEAGLWVALAGAYLNDPEPLRTSIVATGDNLVGGAGGWGFSLLVLAGLVALVLLLVRDAGRMMLRYPVTTFIPLGLLLAYLREGAYRVGPGDSLNRMWLHVLPLAVLLVAAAAGTQLHTVSRRRELTTP